MTEMERFQLERDKAIELVESCIMDFRKLAPVTGGATEALAIIYETELLPLKRKNN